MSFGRQTKFIFAVVIQMAVIFGIIIFKLAILTGGSEVLLQIEPVDPRDLLRGDYLTFQYKISNTDSYLFNYSPVRNGDTVYVPLKRVGKYWTTTSGIQKSKPSIKGEIFIKGKVASGGEEEKLYPFEGSRPRSYSSRIRIIYGIEDYFIPEGKGSSLNRWERGNELSAKVAIDENGNAILKQIYLDGKPWP